ncbi:MAG: hypothetical protein WBB45_17390 [Cyclobacteriaceae bacterium]
MEEASPQPFVPYWMRGFLLLASFYNLFWAIFIYWFPDSFYRWVTQRSEDAPLIISWQAIGIFIFSVFYFLTALYPKKFRILITLGILSKLLGGVWFYLHVMEQTVNKKFFFHLIANDLIWIPLFAFIAFRMFTKKDQYGREVKSD